MTIAVIGDVIIDEYIYGQSQRLSPEAPVPVVDFVKKETKNGGAANVFENLKSLTDDVIMCSYCDDPPKKQRIYSGDYYLTRIDYPGNNIWKIDASYQSADCVVISDYDKGSVGDFQKYLTLNAPVIVDPKKNLDFYQGAWCIKPNKKEFERYAGRWDSPKELETLMKISFNNLRTKHMIVTLGKEGVAYYDGKEFLQIASKEVEVYDVTGAGDTFTAVLSWSIHQGKDMVESLIVANKASAVSVQHRGTYIIKPSDILDNVIVFTNGCFDILHLGHIEYLKKSRSLGSRLIVGLNSDASVTRLKGPGRPINNEISRKKILESLSCVDEVIIFEEDTPIELIKKIRPNIITKGSDYTVESVVGNELCEVRIIPLEKEFSTTNILGKIKHGF